MAIVRTGGKQIKVNEGTSLKFLAMSEQAQYENDIVLAKVNGKLKELRKQVSGDSEVTFITTNETVGMQTYRRSALMVMMKAIYDCVAIEDLQSVYSDFSVNNGLFIMVDGNVTCDEAFAAKIRERMQEIIEADLPFEKFSVPVEEARAIFRKLKMFKKDRLFRYRRHSKVNLYSLDGFMDYFYGYMVPSTGYIKVFDVLPYHGGLILALPKRSAPKVIPEDSGQEKRFALMMDTSRWCDRMGLATVGEINDKIAAGLTEDMILVAEARQEAKIAAIASMIAERKDVKFVMIAGPSSSGKTSFSHRLSIQLRANGLNPHPIAVDDYFVNREDTPVDEDGKLDFEALECVDVKLFNEDMKKLLAGERVELPTFDFVQGRRTYKGNYLQIGASDILVIEGIHCLNDRLSESLPPEAKFRIYISALSQLNIDEHNRIPTTDGRLVRRMIRDARTRGTSARDTIARWPSVRRGEERNIFPFQESADVMFDSSLIYEFSVLKPYAEQLLFGIPEDCEEYLEAKKLLKFFDYFLAVSSDAIPGNSLLKEFIGGSLFKV